MIYKDDIDIPLEVLTTQKKQKYNPQLFYIQNYLFLTLQIIQKVLKIPNK